MTTAAQSACMDEERKEYVRSAPNGWDKTGGSYKYALYARERCSATSSYTRIHLDILMNTSS